MSPLYMHHLHVATALSVAHSTLPSPTATSLVPRPSLPAFNGDEAIQPLLVQIITLIILLSQELSSPQASSHRKFLIYY